MTCRRATIRYTGGKSADRPDFSWVVVLMLCLAVGMVIALGGDEPVTGWVDSTADRQ